MSENAYLLLADAALALHAGFVLFVVGGALLILIGGGLGWRWVRNPWLRWCHLAGVGVVVVQAWAGIICPLTTLEMWLRQQAGTPTYSGSFIGHWLQTLLYYSAPDWVFTLCYTVFGLLVLAGWFWIRPRPFFMGD